MSALRVSLQKEKGYNSASKWTEIRLRLRNLYLISRLKDVMHITSNQRTKAMHHTSPYRTKDKG
jgi:hypothetical protein